MKKHRLITIVSKLESEVSRIKERNTELEGELTRLKRTVENLQREKELFERLSLTDSMTGIGNKAAFSHAMAIAAEDHRRSGRKFVLVIIDINNLKPINDKFGHEAGDGLIKSTAKLLEGVARKTDRVFRLGGDEFAVILLNTSNGLPFKRRLEKISEKEDISMASGWAGTSSQFFTSIEEFTKGMFETADREMYIEKSRIKTAVILEGFRSVKRAS